MTLCECAQFNREHIQIIMIYYNDKGLTIFFGGEWPHFTN